MKVFVAEPMDGLEHALQPLKAAGHELVLGPPVSRFSAGYGEERLIELCRDADAFIGVEREKVTPAVLDAAARLRVVSKFGSGVDNIDVAAATRNGIIVANAPMHTVTVAEYTVGVMLAVLRKIPRTMQGLLDGNWRDASAMGSELYKKTVGIAGFGAIGKAVCKRLQGWDARILAYDPALDASVAAELGAEAVSWEMLFSEADIVSLHMPLLETTRGIVGGNEFGLMRNHAVLINTSRGPVVDERALVEALEKGEIGGAGLDVFASEPLPPGSPLRAMPNVVLTPHVAGYTGESLLRIALQTTRNCLQALGGDVPDYVVNGDVIPHWKKRFGAERHL